jgi:AcrR family transcriptional regulator
MTFGKPGRPPEDRLARQREIFEAVAPLMVARGARKLTMRDAAHAACLSVGGLYHYFPTKRDLLMHGLSHQARRRIFMESREALRRGSALDRGAYLDMYIERTLMLWAFVHPSVQAALELGYEEFQGRLDAGFAASTAEFAEVLRVLASDLSEDRLAALVRAVQRLALGTVIDRAFDRESAQVALRATLERYLPAEASVAG